MKLKEVIAHPHFPINRQVMLLFQQHAIDYDDKGVNSRTGYEVTADFKYDSTLEIHFPEHYGYSINVGFNADRIKARINIADCGTRTYVFFPCADTIVVYVMRNALANGHDSMEFRSWGAAISFFFTEVKAQIAQLFVEDPTLSKR